MAAEVVMAAESLNFPHMVEMAHEAGMTAAFWVDLHSLNLVKTTRNNNDEIQP